MYQLHFGISLQTDCTEFGPEKYCINGLCRYLNNRCHCARKLSPSHLFQGGSIDTLAGLFGVAMVATGRVATNTSVD